MKPFSAHNWRENQVGFQLQVSNYKKFKSGATWSRADYARGEPITIEKFVIETIRKVI